jgi:hypothetical protein
VLFAALFYTLNTGEIANTLSLEKINLQANLRHVIDWIIKDVRQTNLIEINSNNPSISHIKFRQVTGIDNTSGNYTVASNYIEYNYTNATFNLTRNEISATNTTLRSWAFSNITQAPFYTAPGVPLVSTPGAAGNILIAKKLLLVIAGQRQARGTALNLTLTEEVKVRNE